MEQRNYYIVRERQVLYRKKDGSLKLSKRKDSKTKMLRKLLKKDGVKFKEFFGPLKTLVNTFKFIDREMYIDDFGLYDKNITVFLLEN